MDQLINQSAPPTDSEKTRDWELDATEDERWAAAQIFEVYQDVIGDTQAVDRMVLAIVREFGADKDWRAITEAIWDKGIRERWNHSLYSLRGTLGKAPDPLPTRQKPKPVSPSSKYGLTEAQHDIGNGILDVIWDFNPGLGRLPDAPMEILARIVREYADTAPLVELARYYWFPLRGTPLDEAMSGFEQDVIGYLNIQNRAARNAS